MKIDFNGVIRDATESELQELNLMTEVPTLEPTPEDRLAVLESALLEIGIMLGGM